jgi:hypothetical protein
MRTHVSEIDIAKLTKVAANLTGRAEGVADILMPYLSKLKPQLVVSVGECDYEILIGKERGELIAELNRWLFTTKLPLAAEIVAEKYDIKRVWIIYGEWDTLLVFI